MNRFPLLLLALLLIGCVPQPATVQQMPVGAPLPASCLQGGTDAGANATVAARCQEDTAATVNAIGAATAVAVRGTEEARIAATSEAEAVASQTAVAATATGADLVVRQTEQAMAFQQADATGTAAAAATADSRLATRESDIATAEAENLRLQQEAAQREIDRQEKSAAFWTTVGYVLLVVLVVIILGLAIYIGVWVWTNRKSVQVVKDHEGRVLQVFVMAPDGYRALSSNQMLISQPDVAGLLTSAKKPVPDWSAFMGHRDRFSIPVGVDMFTQQPIFIDRREQPHVLFAGASGAGKSASGIIPFVLAMWGTNAHVMVVNGKGADYNALNDELNFTMFTRSDTAELIRPLSALLDALEKEYQRRSQVLARYNTNDWSALPEHAGEYGEIVFVLEEFLAIIEKADEVARLARINKDTAAAQEMEMVVAKLWFRLSSLVSQARKTGIFLVAVFTDATNDAIGKQAAKVKRGMARVVFRMNSAPSSRSLLDIERGSDYANGTVGLPTGEFLVNTNGQVRHGIGFYPQDRDIDNFLVSRQVRPSPLPDLVLNAIQTESGVWTTQQPAISAPGAPVARLQQPINQAEKDGRDLSNVIEAMTSLNDVARHFSGVPFDDRTYRPDGKLISTRVRPALVWRVRKLNCEKSRLLLS